MRDIRDPEQLYIDIVSTKKHFGCTFLEAADRVEAMRDDRVPAIALFTNGRYSQDATRAISATASTDPGEPPTARR